MVQSAAGDDMEVRVECVVESSADSGTGIWGDVAMLLENAARRGKPIRAATIWRQIEAKKRRELAKKKVCEEVLPEWQKKQAQL